MRCPQRWTRHRLQAKSQPSQRQLPRRQQQLELRQAGLFPRAPRQPLQWPQRLHQKLQPLRLPRMPLTLQQLLQLFLPCQQSPYLLLPSRRLQLHLQRSQLSARPCPPER